MAAIGYGILAFLVFFTLMVIAFGMLFEWEEDKASLCANVSGMVSFLIGLSITLITWGRV